MALRNFHFSVPNKKRGESQIFSEELRKFTTKIVRNSLKNDGKICVKIGRLSIPRKSGSYGRIPQTADKDKSAKYIFKYRSN